MQPPFFSLARCDSLQCKLYIVRFHLFGLFCFRLSDFALPLHYPRNSPVGQLRDLTGNTALSTVRAADH